MKQIKDNFFVSNNEGTIFGSINKEELFELKILIFSEILQKKYELVVSKIDYKIKNQCNQIDKLQELKNVLLSKMSKV